MRWSGVPTLIFRSNIESNYQHKMPPWSGDEERDEDPGTQLGAPGKRTGWSGMEISTEGRVWLLAGAHSVAES